MRSLKSINYLFLTILMVSIGCTADSKYGPFFTPYFGNADYHMNEEHFVCFPYADTSNFKASTIDLVLVYYNEFKIFENTLFLHCVPLTQGQYNIVTGDAGSGLIVCSLSTWDYDVTTSSYEYDSTQVPSFINVIGYNADTKEIRGNFNLHLKRVELYYTLPLYPEFVHVVGNFYTKVGYEE